MDIVTKCSTYYKGQTDWFWCILPTSLGIGDWKGHKLGENQ